MIGNRLPGNRLPGNPAANTAISIVLAPICILLVVGARIDNWWHTHAIARTKRRDARRQQRIEAWDSLGCIEDNEL